MPMVDSGLTVDWVSCTKYKPAFGGLEVFQEPVESSSVLQGAASLGIPSFILVQPHQ